MRKSRSMSERDYDVLGQHYFADHDMSEFVQTEELKSQRRLCKKNMLEKHGDRYRITKQGRFMFLIQTLIRL